MNDELSTNQDTQAQTPQVVQTPNAARNKKLLGLAMLAGGSFLLFMNWQSVRSSGTYWPMISVLAPTAIGIGISTLVFPERKTHNALGFVGFILGIVNWLFISGTL
jgi:hypothetical protein